MILHDVGMEGLLLQMAIDSHFRNGHRFAAMVIGLHSKRRFGARLLAVARTLRPQRLLSAPPVNEAPS
jgi:hypothetical protein